jgi:hypothetical protein
VILSNFSKHPVLKVQGVFCNIEMPLYKMKNKLLKNQLMQDTIRVTTEIGTYYPELYKFLNETPLFLSTDNEDEVCSTDFEKYLSTIKHQLQNYIATHKNSSAPIKKSNSL